MTVARPHRVRRIADHVDHLLHDSEALPRLVSLMAAAKARVEAARKGAGSAVEPPPPRVALECLDPSVDGGAARA